MKSSTLRSLYDNPSIGKQVINYVNAIPGSGKTYQFLKLAKRFIRDHESGKIENPGILIYAAPTELLLDQVTDDLVLRGVEPNRIKRVSSKSGTGRVVDKFRLALAGSKKLNIKKIPDGTILLVTHECLARSPEEMAGRHRATLFYDEARACLEDSYSVVLPTEIYNYLTKVERIRDKSDTIITTSRVKSISAVLLEGTTSSEELFIWKWRSRIELPTEEYLASLINSNQRKSIASKVYEFLINLSSSSLDIYVSVKKIKDKEQYHISKVLSPNRMFNGFRKVVILSALFETSQMFHFLKSANRDSDSEQGLILRDITNKYIDTDRMKRIIQRLRNTDISYVYELGERCLTKSEMTQGIVVSGLPKDKKELDVEWKNKFKNRRPLSYREAYSLIRDQGEVQSISLSDYKAQLDFLESKLSIEHVHRISVIQHMVEASLCIYSEWREFRKVAKAESLPVGVNTRFGASGNCDTTVWDKEKLNQFNLRDKAYRKPKNMDILTQLPMVCHGQNKWKTLHSAVFLASMKYRDSERTFLNRIIPSYDPSIDRTVDYALQVLFRCNVRDAESEKPCLWIVTDRKIAEELKSRFINIAESLGENSRGILKIINPKFLMPKYSPAYILKYDTPWEESYRTNYKGSGKGRLDAAYRKEYSESEAGKAYLALSMKISRYKKQGKDVSDLITQRSRLLTPAQWKKSDEGISVIRELSKPKFNPIEAAREALSKLPDFDNRADRLKVLSILKRTSLSLEEDARNWYSGDGFNKNWKDAERYATKLTLGWLFKMAGKYGNSQATI